LPTAAITIFAARLVHFLWQIDVKVYLTIF